MSDCHSWFGSERSKRRTGFGSRSRVGVAGSRSPSSCRMRRTVCSDTPSPSKRASTSSMRRLPYSGCSCLTRVTASRVPSSDGFGRSPRLRVGLASSPSTPFSR